MPDGGYYKIEVYKLAHELGVQVHKMTLKLPAFEVYEEASQVRRSSKRVSASIVEGYALRMYKAQFLNYLYRAVGSSDETQEHLLYLTETGSATNQKEIQGLLKSYQDLSRKLVRFIQGVERAHTKPQYLESGSALESGIGNLESEG